MYPYARPEGLGKAFKAAVGRSEFIIATFLTLLLAVYYSQQRAGDRGGAWIISTLAALYIKKQIGGLTGDSYGAVNEIALSRAAGDEHSGI